MFDDILGKREENKPKKKKKLYVAILKSGGPIMDVLGIVGNDVLCEWEDNDGNRVKKIFNADVLRFKEKVK